MADNPNPSPPADWRSASTTTPSLSVIVPAHRVQGYIRQCLESILACDLPNLEVIAVNDASPDRCGEILDEIAARDPRVRVRHLTENVGLGEARNIGLDMATGDYVWFFDSDDYATEGAVQAIVERLAQTRPDVLLFDYAREYWHGKVKRSVINDLFRVPPAPDVFTCAERPSVLRLMMTAWNRAIRREFLLGLGLRFSRGHYEDFNLTYPILMVAERISLLDQVCYIYRQRRRGAITKTRSQKHFDAFAQYDRVFAFMDQMGPEADQFRARMFDRTIWHLLVIIEADDRVPEADRARFFAGMSEVYRRYRPSDHVMPDDELLAKKYRLIVKNDYKGFERLHKKIRARKAAGKAKRKVKAFANNSKRRGMQVYYQTQLRRPIDENLAVYAAYWHRGYACNPAAIYEKAKELAPHIKGVWVVKPENVGDMPKGVPYVVHNSKDYWRLIARAKYFVNNVNFSNALVKRRGQIHVMTEHGTPLKRMGLDQLQYPAGGGTMDFDALIRRADRWDFHLSANPLTTEAWERSFPCDYEMLEIGYPRNDRLVRATDQERDRLRAELGIPEGKKAILYTPTHRDYRRDFAPMFDIRRFAQELGEEYVLLLRAHYFYKPEAEMWDRERVIDVSGHPSVEDLCIASDALLTDYSSIMFDYAVLPDRPIVIFANDWETYKLTRGVNFDLTEFPPGVVAYTEEDLLKSIRSGAPWGEAAARSRGAFRERFCPWEDGRASERAVRRVFLGENVPNPPQP
ncbi:bifunctional glycosyltransferase/CDP-glycerol:glycerophosphate glycerophosphotransferase [Actinomadura rudentiformis]|uniref:Bifunctional glycosyltransferase family 2 protein/CDP-glycerol:glycerophosphate glycerophosphotransferase n=1 Tax=Actinomadura rudentiformis TaxID=359158 RepID=A0A6H9YYE3_9ACTN|nr:bifunctional glycosyltransferase family 2 protein/CDP-glycerol:glycerophosphate glycerophosphotransferase [Actinomadura rudentiformis]KAB2351553.1 bifunctional glycosyltransferase family 2 protein/CDP-glycerol:glycerophosphate glycerophosphotransferase [Actinomadura rudentiformis]